MDEFYLDQKYQEMAEGKFLLWKLMAILKFGEIDINRIYNAQLDEAGEAADARSSFGASATPG